MRYGKDDVVICQEAWTTCFVQVSIARRQTKSLKGSFITWLCFRSTKEKLHC